jgi:hypothetical protein
MTESLSTAQPALPIDELPPNLRKHVDPASPKPLRLMAAKALVPMAPAQITASLYILTHDPERDVAETAHASAQKLPDRILTSALRDESLDAGTLGLFAEVLGDRDNYLELIVLNGSASDETIALVARHGSTKICELVAQNQLRLLRCEALLRGLLGNPALGRSVADSVADFAVRSGVNYTDLPALVEARRRVFGDTPIEEGPTADQVAAEFSLKQEATQPLEEGKRQSLAQRVMKMNVSQRIKLAALGNKEARTLLLRDTNKLVSMAAVQSPRITEGEVLLVAGSRTAPDDQLRYIYNNRDWTKSYQLRLAMVKNPKVPLPVAMRFMATLREAEVREISRSKNVPGGVAHQARITLEKRAGGDKKGKG